MATNHAAITRTAQPRSLAPWHELDWQRVWLAAWEHEQAWRSLAIVPAGPGATPELTLQIAVTLSNTGMSHLGNAIHVADGTRLALSDLVDFSDEIARCTSGSDLVLVALAPVIQNVTTVSIAQALDRALLCVVGDRMKTADTKRTITEIGDAKFIGSVFCRLPDELET